MSKTPSGRGRVVAKQSSSMTLVYVVLGIVALGGLGLIAYFALNPGQATSTNAQGTVTARGTGQALDIATFPSQGEPSAPVTVIEYADYQCPACAFFATSLKGPIAKEYIDTGKVRLIFHEYPLPQHRNAIPAAESARCAGEQGKYWEMHDQLFTRQTEWDKLPNPAPTFSGYASAIGVADIGNFNTCLTSRKFKPTVEQAGLDADAAGVSSTPTFVINGKNFGMNDLKRGIDEALAAK
jgi:protein-disulfide isomerase